MDSTPLFTAPRRPYYISAPAYRRTSAGIKVLHLLCHALNRLGEEAYVFTGQTNPLLQTPVWSPDIGERHAKAGREPITVYPEVTVGNPFKGRSVVRYLLNRAGLLGGTAEHADGELVFAYGRNLLPDGVDPANLLFVPSVDTTVFHNRDNPDDARRDGVLFYAGRHPEGLKRYPELAAGATHITSSWPESHEALAALFRRSKRLYCFESTAVALEAILCGCPAVFLPSPLFDGTLINSIELGRDGCAIGDAPEEIAFAERTVGLMQDRYRQAEANFWQQLQHFIEVTQAMPVQDVPVQAPADPALVEADRLYQLWRTRQTLQEIDAELLAERMVLHWNTRPVFHLLLELRPGEESLLADTLDSLGAQLYREWMLTIVTTLPVPDGLAEVPNLQWLTLRDAEQAAYVLDEMAAASACAWVARIDPGLVFEPQALQVIADYINARPAWRLVYCDEDTREPDGRYTQPCFKPDVNPDLLRSQAYFGSLVVVEKQAFLAAGRYGGCGGAENYDLSLRLLDHAGETAVGHISQLLVHLPRASGRAMQPEAEKIALAGHLARNRLDAQVQDGAYPGLRRVRYRWPATPRVSIVIQTRDREEYLKPLLESMRDHTAYPCWDVVVVDNDTTDPDALRYLAGLASDPGWQGRMRVIAVAGPFDYAAGANAGAAVARGEYLLFLDNDTHVVQDQWLDCLVGIAQRPEVGIVGPRLTYPETAKVQHAGWILGYRGAAGSCWDNDLEISEPGYMGRALCEQAVGAVSGSALMVRKSVFDALGGMDAARFPMRHAALDLCLRVADAGRKVVWTPHATLVHYGGMSMQARQRRPEGALADMVAARHAHDALLDRWLPRLANDPAYNRNLSLMEGYKPEHVAPIDWDLNFHGRTRILGVPLTGGSGEYRVRAPLRAMGKAGLAQTMICEPPKAFQVRILQPVELARAAPDVIIMQQPLGDPQADALESYARHLPGIRRVISLDDLITDMPRKSSSYKSGFKDGRPRLRRVLSLADRLVVSTQPLADLCAEMIGDIRVMPNCLEGALWNAVAPPGLPRRKPRVGWAGAQQHLGDLELVYPVVEALAGEVDWIFMGMCPDPIKPYVRESHDFQQDFLLYPQALARLDLDLAIAPLEMHAFNEAKSNLRLLEYGAMGWPVICTDIYPYHGAPVTRLPNDPDRWIATIREQLSEPEALREAGARLQQWVRSGFLLEDHAANWFAAYGGWGG